MSKFVHAFASALVVAVPCIWAGPALADVVYSTSTTISSWNGSPVYASVATPATATTAQNNNGVTSTGATQYALVETFTPSTSFTLGGLAISTGGTGSVPMSLHLYDVTSAGGSGITSTSNYSVASSSLTDLFGNGAGLSFTQAGSSSQIQDIFTLSNGTTNDLVSLTAGHTYAVEFWVPYSTNSFTWERAGAVATDGQMLFSADPNNAGTGPISANPGNYPHEDSRITITSAGFAGGAPRTGSLALYAVPEPTTFVLFGLALPVLVWNVRKRKLG